MAKAFYTKEMLLSYVPADQVQGQKPASWWIPRIHDVCLFWGTYIHGYGNYTQMKEDPTLSF
jgi:hypothetical protein